MREIWSLDAETDPFLRGRIPAPFLWGAYNGCEYFEFENTEDVVDFFRDKNAIVYAHNGGKFDYFFLLEYLSEFSEVMTINGRLSKFKIGECEFRDSYNILPFPLSSYKKDEVDYKIFEKSEREKLKNKKIISDYLRADCRYLYEIVAGFIDEYGLHLTQAGAAMKIFEKMSGRKSDETSKLFYETFSDFYFGGRVECFDTGIFERDVTIIDINSAYPHAMKFSHASGTHYSMLDSLPNSEKKIQRSFIKLHAKSTGAFPFREKTGLTFPSDGVVREFHVTGWEYLAARDTNTLDDVDIIECLSFDECIEFNEYVDTFYDKKVSAKAAGDKAKYHYAKIFLNALYGKFGANPDNYDENIFVKPCNIQCAEDDGYEFECIVGGWAMCSRPLPRERHRYYNVATAASITGFVRAQMWRAINKCTGVIYCDTDSIFCSDTGTLALDATELGAWDIEAVASEGAVAGKKLYAFKTDKKWKIASKGARLGHNDIYKVARGGTAIYMPESPSFSLKRGIQFISRKIQKTC